MTLVDTNILLDLTGKDAGWAEWSGRALEVAFGRGPVFVNDVVFAELSIGFDRLEGCEGLLDAVGIGILPIPRPALFLAGKVFQAYRRRGGPRTGVLPDFFIGAHAAVEGLPLITRDVRRYRTYFPTIDLIAP
ncbi:MAG: type II toxin-antitoxin system VapC family toxin [Paracraurococcus sp.]